VALMVDRKRAGREASRSAGMIDSRSVKAPQAETRGCDAGRKIVGHKRHIAVDTDGRFLMVNLTTGDSAGAQAILDGVRGRWRWVKHLRLGKYLGLAWGDFCVGNADVGIARHEPAGCAIEHRA
jgi:hypothetical protein